AHVVNIALGRDHRTQDQPTDEVSVGFTAGAEPQLWARVQRWVPPPSTGALGDDIAGLVLASSELPAGATAARLTANPPARGQVVQLFGYPLGRPHGAWAEATVRGLIGGRHLQLDATPSSALWRPAGHRLRRRHRPALGPSHRRLAGNAAGTRRGRLLGTSA
ncbi:MAG: hypothetical protein ACRDTF_15855, partial [Pseudonocardiaceae bacterium]